VKFVGDRLRRKEDPRLLEGRGRYVGDIVLPGMLHAANVERVLSILYAVRSLETVPDVSALARLMRADVR
jgi:carbon-monoxide dehydrogenase large subunit